MKLNVGCNVCESLASLMQIKVQLCSYPRGRFLCLTICHLYMCILLLTVYWISLDAVLNQATGEQSSIPQLPRAALHSSCFVHVVYESCRKNIV